MKTIHVIYQVIFRNLSTTSLPMLNLQKENRILYFLALPSWCYLILF
jgi:hypothetical protein